MKKRYAGILIIAILSFVLWIWRGNTHVQLSQFDIEGAPCGFEGFKIAHVSDLHNAELGKNNKNVIKKLEESDCDIIVITGDLIDSRCTRVDVAVDFVSKACEIAPVYYVNGNHEARARDDYEQLKELMHEAGAVVLENEKVEIERGNDIITMVGLNDTGFDLNTGIDYVLSEVMPEGDSYKVLLAHRPEYFDKYDGVDLIFSGHAHGGQIRIPLLGGVFAPGQGFLPKYTNGVYSEDDKTMVVTRGLGNSLFPFRVNNSPEVIVVTLKSEED